MWTLRLNPSTGSTQGSWRGPKNLESTPYTLNPEETGHLQVYMMDKRLVDPRRPRHEKLTEAEREERLQPYSPLLYQASNMFVTYNRDVARLAGEGAL